MRTEYVRGVCRMESGSEGLGPADIVKMEQLVEKTICATTGTEIHP